MIQRYHIEQVVSRVQEKVAQLRKKLQALQQENAAVLAVSARDVTGTDKLKSLLDITQQRRMAAETQLAKVTAELAHAKAHFEKAQAEAAMHAQLHIKEAAKRASELRGARKELAAQHALATQLQQELQDTLWRRAECLDASELLPLDNPSNGAVLIEDGSPVASSSVRSARALQERLDAAYAQVCSFLESRQQQTCSKARFDLTKQACTGELGAKNGQQVQG